MPRPRPPLRRILLRIAASTVLTLLLLELVLRFLPNPVEPLRAVADQRGFYRMDGEGHLETTPHFEGTVTVDGRTTRSATNGLGLRGDDLPPKAAGERRVLMLGDSFVWGTGVAAEEAIPAQLERRLTTAGATLRVGNAGMIGTGPREWTHTLQRHRGPFAPDAVIAVSYAGNDAADTLSDPLVVADGWLLPSTFQRLYRHSLRMQLLVHWRTWMYLEWFVLMPRWPIAGPPPAASLLPPGMGTWEAHFLDVAPGASAPWLAAIEPRLQAPFDAFAAAVAADDLPALVVVLPAREACSPALWQEKHAAMLAAAKLAPDAVPFERGAAGRRLATLAGRAGLRVVDLTDRFFALPDPDAVFLSDYHLNARGCALVAEWLQPFVQDLLQ